MTEAKNQADRDQAHRPAEEKQIQVEGHEGKIEVGSLGRARTTVSFKSGIDQETAKKISKDIRDGGFKKVQVQIQGEELRVTSPSRDELQAVIAFLKPKDFGVQLMFGNYR